LTFCFWTILCQILIFSSFFLHTFFENESNLIHKRVPPFQAFPKGPKPTSFLLLPWEVGEGQEGGLPPPVLGDSFAVEDPYRYSYT
jgi:hypothetical protein